LCSSKICYDWLIRKASDYTGPGVRDERGRFIKGGSGEKAVRGGKACRDRYKRSRVASGPTVGWDLSGSNKPLVVGKKKKMSGSKLCSKERNRSLQQGKGGYNACGVKGAGGA